MEVKAKSTVMIVFACELKLAAVALRNWRDATVHGSAEKEARIMINAFAAALHGVDEADISQIMLSHADPIVTTLKASRKEASNDGK